MRFLMKYLRGQRTQAVLAPLFKMLEATLELLVPLVVRDIIDVGIGGGDNAYIARRALLLVCFALVGLGFSVTAQYFSARAAVGVASRLRSDLFAHVSAFSFSQIDAAGTSTLITRMTGDVNQIQNGVNLTLRLLLRSPFVVFGAVVMAFTVDARTALVFAAAVPLLTLAVVGVMRVSMPLYKTAQQRLDAVLRAVREHLNGVRVLRAFGKEPEELAAFKEKNAALTRANRRAGYVSALTNHLTYVILNLAVAALIMRGALRVDAGAITRGDVVALYNYMSQILVELIKLASLVVTISRALASAKRVEEVFAQTPGLPCPAVGAQPDFSAPAVECRNVSLCYAGNAGNSLEGVSFTANRGERVGVIGSTGAGKSTLAQLIPRFYDATGGEVRVFGHNVKDYAPETLASLVAVVPQKAVLFSGTVRDNLRWGAPDATDDALLAALDTAQAADVLANKSGGLDAEVEQNGKNFSGGQRQRLTVARALVKNAPILILDDAASALDFATERRLREALQSLPGRPLVITVSQRASSVAACDTILVLEDGRVSAMGDHETLLKENDVYAEICRAAEGGADRG